MSVTRELQLWLSNEEAPYKACMAMARDCLRRAVDNESHARSARNDAVEMLAGDIRTYVEASAPDCVGMWNCLINSMLNDVDFEQVAQGYLEDEPIFSVFSSDAEDAELFLSVEDARDCLAGKLDDDNTMHAGLFLKVAGLKPGEVVSIDGVEYTLAES